MTPLSFGELPPSRLAWQTAAEQREAIAQLYDELEVQVTMQAIVLDDDTPEIEELFDRAEQYSESARTIRDSAALGVEGSRGHRTLLRTAESGYEAVSYLRRID